MVTFWAETPAGRVIQLVGLVFVMLAIAEYANVIDFLPLNSYVIIIGVIVLLRWFIQTYHKRGRENVQ
jgi:hypothetical protein